MLADLYSPGPDTTDLQGQWINATTSPPGGPPVYGTPGPADDVDLEGFDITASGGSVRSIYNVGSLSVTGMVSAVEASEFTLRGSGTLNIDHVGPNIGLAVVGGHLKASGAADFVDVSSGGVVTAATCKGSSFSGGSSLTFTIPSLDQGSAHFFSGSSFTAMGGLTNFLFDLHGGSTAHLFLTYDSGNQGSVLIDGGSSLNVDSDYRISQGNLAISGGATAAINGPMYLQGGQVSIDQGTSKLTAAKDIFMNGGDLQLSNGGFAKVTGKLEMPRGHIAVSDAGSVLAVDALTLGGDPTQAPAVVDVDTGAIQQAGGPNAKITVNDSGVLNVQDSRASHTDTNVTTDSLFVDGGTLNVAKGGNVRFKVLDVTRAGHSGSGVAVSGGDLNGGDMELLGSNLDLNDGGDIRAEILFVNGGRVSVSGDGSLLTISDTVTIAGSGSGPGGTLQTTDRGAVAIGSTLSIPSSGGVNTFAGGTIIIGDEFGVVADGQVHVGAGGRLDDNGTVTCQSAFIEQEGILTGKGTINGKTFNSGRIFPGNSPGILSVQGDYTQNSDGLLGIEIGGTDAGTDYDQLQVSGTATIAGTLQVRLMNGFTPTVGQTYRIVTAGSFSGAFSSIVQPSQAGISVSNDASGVTVTITSVVAGAPVISGATTVAATQGQAFSYQITATNNPATFGAMNLPDGLTVDQTSGLISGTPTKAGTYVVQMAANNNAGSGQADLIIGVGLPAATTPSQLLNISTRMRVLTGDNVLIGGFIITGTEPKKVIVRGIGPSLAAVGLSDVLADPTLELHQPDGTVITNDNWKINAQTGQSQEADIRATTVAPTDDLESAIVATLPPGTYTAILADKNQSPGIGVVEVYDLAQAANSTLANISSRGFVDTGDNVMIGGFIVGGGTGGGVATVIVRAIGPSLSVNGAPVPNRLADPTLELHNANGTMLVTNDNWKIDDVTGQSQEADIRATTVQPTDDLESAILATLPPDNYTAIVRGKNNNTGVGVVEVYKLQ